MNHKKLNLLGLEENTIFIFFSDNGGLVSRFDKVPLIAKSKQHIYEGDSLLYIASSNAPLRAEKGTLYEGGIREPLIIKWPGKITAGSRSEVPVSSVDFFPTLLQLTGTQSQQVTDGQSLLPELLNDAGMERDLFWHYPVYHHSRPASAIRSEDWKLIHYYEEDRTELYDLQKGPFEEKDVAENFPDIAASLSEILQKWLTEAGAAYPKEDTLFDAAERQDYDSTIVHKLLPKLEAERQRMLSDDFEPNPDWWGSKVTKD